MSLYHRKPTGWNGSDKVFDTDADIIDYQVAIVEYANGVGMNFHTNLNAPDQFRRFAAFGTRGQAEGDFIRGFFKVTDVLTEQRVLEKEYKATALSQHYGADEEMAAGIVDYAMKGVVQPVSTLDALEAGILAFAMDDARRTKQVIDLRPIWDRYDNAFHTKAA
jgi:predicted dehydrogenase